MPPTLALLLWFVLLLALFLFDPAKEPKVSPALWIPVISIFFLASRSPSQWVGGSLAGGGGSMAEDLMEGNPLNRTVSLVLWFLAIAVLFSRSFRWGEFFARNSALAAYLLFGLLSILWSDFAFPAFRKWFRDLGYYWMILVVLSDAHPLEALCSLLRRLGYLLLPLSVLLIKYYPSLAKNYDQWTGLGSYTGATSSKNMLGILCLVCGTYFLWDTVARWSYRKEDKRQEKVIFVNLAFIVMTVWLLNICDSVTSWVCLVFACLVILAAQSKVTQRRPGILLSAIPIVFLSYALAAWGFGMSEKFAVALGRDPTLTGRTQIWQIVLSQNTNPLLGAGYENFWLGDRLENIWSAGGGIINEAHNGYLELYVNLGYIGLFLGLLFVIAVYRNICKRLKLFSSIASLSLAIWTAFLFHNSTEADFRSGLMWFTFVLGGLAVSEVKREGVAPAAAVSHAETAAELASPLCQS